MDDDEDTRQPSTITAHSEAIIIPDDEDKKQPSIFTAQSEAVIIPDNNDTLRPLSMSTNSTQHFQGSDITPALPPKARSRSLNVDQVDFYDQGKSSISYYFIPG